jgi:hypothetical protein
MTEKDLQLANNIQREIKNIEHFIWKAEKVWTGKLIQRVPILTFKSTPYGIFESSEFDLSTELKNKVLNVLRKELEILKEKLILI